MIKKQDWLLNQAVLTVYVDKSIQKNNTDVQPNRLFVYDAKNNKTLIDYDNDGTTNPEKNSYNGIIDVTSENNKTKNHQHLVKPSTY